MRAPGPAVRREGQHRPRTHRDLVCIVAAVAVALAFTGPGSARGAAPPKVAPIPGTSGGIVVTSSEGATLATFRSLKCKVAKGKFTAQGFASAHWAFHAEIVHFGGFHSYDIDYGFDGDADFRTGTTGLDFSNLNKPMTGGPVELTKGGSMAFPHGRGRFGIAFGLGYQSGNYHSHASVFGSAPCVYPRAKRGGR